MSAINPVFRFSKKDITRILKTILLIIPIPALVIAGINFFTGRLIIALVVVSIPFFCFISYQLLNMRMFRLPVYLIIIVVSFTITLSSILGNGIHESSIVAFPVIVWLSSFILSSRGVILSTTIVMACLAIITFGESSGLYPVRPIPAAEFADIIAVSLILLMNIIVTYYIASFTKNSLKLAKEEVEAQKQIEKEIESNLELKTNLLREVHHRVKNNLSLINSLIALEQPDGNSEDMALLQSRIQAIARVHDPLFQTVDYQEVEIQDYLEKLVIGFSAKRMLTTSNLEVTIDKKRVSIEKAIPIALILHELMNQFEFTYSSKLSIRLNLHGSKSNLICESETEMIIGPKTEMHLINLMIDELSALMSNSENRIEIQFDL